MGPPPARKPSPMGNEFAPSRRPIVSSRRPTTTVPRARPSFSTGAAARSSGTPDTTRTAATASTEPGGDGRNAHRRQDEERDEHRGQRREKNSRRPAHEGRPSARP